MTECKDDEQLTSMFDVTKETDKDNIRKIKVLEIPEPLEGYISTRIVFITKNTESGAVYHSQGMCFTVEALNSEDLRPRILENLNLSAKKIFEYALDEKNK